MKKFLSIVSLLLVAMMIVAMPAVSAEEVDDSEAAWVAPEGIKTYYATDVSENTPNIDGTIEDGEYGQAIRVTEPRAASNATWGASWELGEFDETLRSQYFDFYFAYDENNIYVAIYEMGPEYVDDGDEFVKDNVPFRDNYMFQFGFDLADLTNYFQFGGYATTSGWANLAYFEFGKRNEAPIKTYDLVSECIVRKTDVNTETDVGFGDLLSSNGNVNYSDGTWAVTMEFKLDREVVADAMNECYFTDYDTTSNAMYFAFITNAYRPVEDDLNNSTTQYFKWMGLTDITGQQGKYTDYGIYDGSSRDSIFDLIVFGDENTAIEVADPFPVREETEPPVTEAPADDTEAPADDTEAPADDTEAPADDTEAPADEGGCGGMVSLAGIALVAALGTCTVFVAKKKEN